MKQQLCLATCLLAFAGGSFAQQQAEGQCKKNVEATISAIEMTAQMKGTEQKLKDLSVKEIRAIQTVKGSCAAQQEINKRTMN